MFPSFPDVSFSVEVLNTGIPEAGQVQAHPEGIVFETMVATSVGITWEDLLKILDHPEVQNRLEDAAIKRGE